MVNLIVSIMLYLISGFFLLQTRSLDGGAEIFPRAVAILLIIASTANLIRTRGKGEVRFSAPVRVLGVILLVIAYAILMNFVGFFATTFLFVIALMLFLNYRKWIVILSVAVGTVVFTYIVFIKIFLIPLPTGFLI